MKTSECLESSTIEHQRGRARVRCGEKRVTPLAPFPTCSICRGAYSPNLRNLCNLRMAFMEWVWLIPAGVRGQEV